MDGLVQEERAVLSLVLHHLKEIDHRKLYADLKCASLFEYCVKILKYSEGQASRRVSACRLLKDLPDILPKIEKGELNLTQLSQARSLFADENITSPEEKRHILNDIAGRSTRETETILDGKRKQPKPRLKALILKEETIELIKDVQDMKAHAFKDIDELIVEMVKLAKREWDSVTVKRKNSITESDTRFIPKQVKTAVFERDLGKCRNCGSKKWLQYDHVIPFAKGGRSTLENLQLLCSNCNQRKAKKDFESEASQRWESFIR